MKLEHILTLKDCRTFIESTENQGWWSDGTTRTFTNTATLTNSGFFMFYSSGTVVNETLYPMLIKGSELKPYEKYGKSPSPDYPSEVETVGSNVNEFDINNTTTVYNGEKNVDEIISNKMSGDYQFVRISTKSIKLIDNNIYTISFKAKKNSGTYSNNMGFQIFDADGKVTLQMVENSPVLSEKYQVYSCTFNVTANINVTALLFQLQKNASEVIMSIKDIKLEKGTVATPYSPFGMGSVEIDVVNKNLLNTANTEETTKGGIAYSIKNGILKLNGTATAAFDIQLSKNIKIKKGKYTHSSSYIQSGLYISFDNLGYTMISSTVGKKRTFEITEDTTYKRYFIWIDKGTVLNTVEIKLQLEVGDTATDFVEHQSQTAIMPVQQEMLQGDYIEDVEHHEWGKLVLKGDEGWEIGSANPYQKQTTYFSTQILDNLLKTEEVISNYFTYKKYLWGEDVEGIFYDLIHDCSLRMRVNKTIASTSSELNAYLKARYDANDPVVIYYKLANAIDLELTEAQKAVREQKLHTYKNVTNINLSDELASIDVTYKKDLDTILNNLQAQIIANASEEVTE